jgi:sugar-specific transcriptional regulator TrmB
MTEIKETLKKFGLTDNEAEVYLILIKSGNLTAAEITGKTHIHRTNVYAILERLQEKGIISFAVHGKRKQYEAVDPKTILNIEREKLEEIEKLVPELSLIKNSLESKQDATVFKDRKGIRNILEELTNSKTDVQILASGGGFEQTFPDYFKIWLSRLSINKVKLKVLLSIKYKGLKAPKPAIYKFMPAEFISPSTTMISEDKVIVLIWGEQPIAIQIKSRLITEAYKNYFNVLWALAV